MFFQKSYIDQINTSHHFFWFHEKNPLKSSGKQITHTLSDLNTYVRKRKILVKNKPFFLYLQARVESGLSGTAKWYPKDWFVPSFYGWKQNLNVNCWVLWEDENVQQKENCVDKMTKMITWIISNFGESVMG